MIIGFWEQQRTTTAHIIVRRRPDTRTTCLLLLLVRIVLCLNDLSICTSCHTLDDHAARFDWRGIQDRKEERGIQVGKGGDHRQTHTAGIPLSTTPHDERLKNTSLLYLEYSYHFHWPSGSESAKLLKNQATEQFDIIPLLTEKNSK